MNKDFKEFCKKEVQRIWNEIPVDEMKVQVLFQKESDDDSEDETTYAEFEINHNYRDAKITVFEELAKKFPKDKEFIKGRLCHEIAHAITSRLQDLAHERHVSEKEIDTETERTTELVSWLIFRIVYKKTM